MEINVCAAKTKLSQLLDRAAAGEEIIITCNGRPVAKLVPAVARAEPRKLGLLRGRIKVSDDFDAPLPESVLRDSEGEP